MATNTFYLTDEEQRMVEKVADRAGLSVGLLGKYAVLKGTKALKSKSARKVILDYIDGDLEVEEKIVGVNMPDIA